MRRIVIALGLLVASLVAASPAQATLFTASAGGLNASADFSLSGTTLTVVLTNTDLDDVLVAAQVLTAVYFDVSGGTLSLAPGSAVLTAGSSVFYDADGQPAGGVVGGEWAYNSGIAAPNGATNGISSTGLGIFGNANFPGPGLAPPDPALDGLQYGLLSAGDNTATGAPGNILGGGGLIKNSVTFTLTFTPDSNPNTSFGISNVAFQYGTDLSEPTIQTDTLVTEDITTETVVPEPTTLALLGSGLLIAARGLRRKSKKQQAAA